jgi:tetratricopeptide (TPR) repeat protein
VARLGLALTLVLGSIACQTGPIRAFQGARYYAAGSDALERGDGERAIFELRRAAELVPHASEIQNHLGLAYLSKGEIARARDAFEIALELDCDNRAAQFNLARLEDRSEILPEGTGATNLRAQQHPASNAVDGEGGENHGR